MLGRTANGLFWMFRYLERAQNTARLLDAGLRLTLTRDNETAEDEWRSVIITSGHKEAYEAQHTTYTAEEVWNFILRGNDNPANVREMFKAVRTNARMVRTAISDEVWESINLSWMALDRMLSRPVSQAKVTEVVRTIRGAGTWANGAMSGSMLRDEGFRFARAGAFLERGDSTARILDMKYYLLLPSLSFVGSSLDTGQWEQVLRSVAGDRVYSWLNAGKLDARGIVDFLVLDDRFPRSLAFSHSALRDQLAALARIHGKEGRCNELMREADILIADITVEQIFDEGLHEFLSGFMARNAAIGSAIADDYRFLD